MSQENVDLSHRFWKAFNDRQWDVWWSLIDEDVEWHARDDKPDVEVYHGHDSLKRLADAWTEMFPDIRIERSGESIDLGDHVITPTFVVGTARTTGIELRDPYTFLQKIAGGKLIVVHELHDIEEAMRLAEAQGA